jgi:hypothetical protein
LKTLDECYLGFNMNNTITECFAKLSSDIKFNFDINGLLDKFDGDRVDPNANGPWNHKIYHDPSGVLHWQYFSGSNTRFSRNFYRNCRDECEHITERMQQIQRIIRETYENQSSITKAFLDHKFITENIVLIMQKSGVSIAPHTDYSRPISLNIGLKNSNAGTTYVAPTTEFKSYRTIDDFKALDCQSYTMNDGDVYLLSTKYTHCVESCVTPKDNRDRYIVSYSIVQR